MRVYYAIFVFISISLTVRGQSQSDTSTLKEVVVKAYFSNQPLLRVPASISVIGSQVLQNQPPGSLLPAINTAPGVRMEERSPGSYRLSIRGSLLRSPFGIRNVKIYLNDFLLTDAGGNTYINVLDASSVGQVEILKGPEGSIFGANSGGVLLINSNKSFQDSTFLSGGVSVGSYGLVHQNLALKTLFGDFELGLNQSFQRSDGYRQNSAMNRKSIQLMPKWQYSSSAALSCLFMYSDLHYRTPGGLTFKQVEENPRLARPGTAIAPGAIEQQAAVFNKTGLIGVLHSKLFSDRLKHIISITGSFTDFENPFITTYENRDENSLGLRTYVEMLSKNLNAWNWQVGLEAQQTNSEKKNYNNLKGNPTEKQDFVDFTANQSFLFSRFSTKINNSLNAEAALSINFYKYSFNGIYPQMSPKETRKFKAQVMPRIAFSYLINNNLAFRASASRGYSPPTIEEVRPSSRVVNTALQPESGWNYESGLRLSLLNNRIYFDGVLFSYHLKDAIVRKVDAADTEFFVNAGSTNQTGFETQLNAWLMRLKNTGIIRGLKISESYTYSDFKFKNYTNNSTDYTGNRLTGVPIHNLVTSLDVYFPLNFGLYIQHSYVSSIPLNDANTAYAAKYNLLQGRLIYKTRLKALKLNFFAGADNLLNSNYSLGNDLNAFGGRFFNPAALMNGYGGLNFQF